MTEPPEAEHQRRYYQRDNWTPSGAQERQDREAEDRADDYGREADDWELGRLHDREYGPNF